MEEALDYHTEKVALWNFLMLLSPCQDNIILTVIGEI